VNAANEKKVGFLRDTYVNSSALTLPFVVVERDARFERINAAMERLMQHERGG